MAASATFGWAFQSSHSLKEMERRLNAIWERPWTMGDSDRHGDYLGGRLTPEGVGRIYLVRGAGFVVNLRFYSESGDPKDQLAKAKARLLDVALPAVEATNVRETDPVE